MEKYPDEGIDPPANITRFYEANDSNPRICIECGKIHDNCWFETSTGNRIENVDQCIDCMMKFWLSHLNKPIIDQVEINEDMSKKPEKIDTSIKHVDSVD